MCDEMYIKGKVIPLKGFALPFFYFVNKFYTIYSYKNRLVQNY